MFLDLDINYCSILPCLFCREVSADLNSSKVTSHSLCLQFNSVPHSYLILIPDLLAAYWTSLQDGPTGISQAVCGR